MYKITEAQKNELENQPFSDNQYYNPVQDINGDWFISIEEYKEYGIGLETEFIPPIPETII